MRYELVARSSLGKFCLGLATSSLIMVSSLVLASESEVKYKTQANQLIEEVTGDVVKWRRDIHEHPELGNREFRTAKKIAKHLRSLGMEVTEGVAHTGVVAILRGKQAKPMVALRADMDALPVKEQTGLKFASKVTSTYLGKDVGVMHACGHDTHVAMLMGVAEVLAGMKGDLPGSVTFIFQPAEEGPPAGEEGGAKLMVEQGALKNVDAIFGLHVGPGQLGSIGYRSGGIMASSDSFRILVKGKQTHGAIPWGGVDPIVTSSQIIMGLQTITSRQLDSTLTPSIVTVGKISGGVRFNIIPDEVEMLGTVRTFDEGVRADIHKRISHTASSIADSAGASAEVSFGTGTPVTSNDANLVAAMESSLFAAAGRDKVAIIPRTTTAEDFAYYQKQIPGLFFFLGTGSPADPRPAPNHSPYFSPDEAAFPTGMRALTYLTFDYMLQHQAK